MYGTVTPSGPQYPEYLDFELQISPGKGRKYLVEVLHSPGGEAREIIRFPSDSKDFQLRVRDLQIALIRSDKRMKSRRVLSPDQQSVQGFGQALFEAVLTGTVRSRYDMSLSEARRAGKGLRLKLRIEPPELAALPWEFMYDPSQAEFLCLMRHTPVVRYHEVSQPIQPLSVIPPLRMLGMIASPDDLPQLDVLRERQMVEDALTSLGARGMIELTWLPGQTWRDLQRAMRAGPWHIFHFIGHGDFDPVTDEGIIALADDKGNAHRLRATELGRWLADQASLRLVVLNSCEGARGSEQDIVSSTASILVRRGIPAVLAMQYSISDDVAIEFARTFYEAVAEAWPVDAALTEARKAISMDNPVEWGTPALYMHCPDGVLFNIQHQPTPLAPNVPVQVISAPAGSLAAIPPVESVPPEVAAPVRATSASPGEIIRPASDGRLDSEHLVDARPTDSSAVQPKSPGVLDSLIQRLRPAATSQTTPAAPASATAGVEISRAANLCLALAVLSLIVFWVALHYLFSVVFHYGLYISTALALIAVACGHKALWDIGRASGHLGGRGRALIGLVIGYAYLAVAAWLLIA